VTRSLLGRDEVAYPEPTSLAQRVLVTGARGSIGTALCNALRASGRDVWEYDLPYDVLQPITLRDLIWGWGPGVVYHLAADKHAPMGEDSPVGVARVNIDGTINAVRAAEDCGSRVILASTCKAAAPETVYGASKLIAERIVLNSGGTVARLYNVIESSRNVFKTWQAAVDAGEPLEVCGGTRRFYISLNEAVSFLLAVADQPSGRYAPDPGLSVRTSVMARRFAPNHPQRIIEPRRGDRLSEPLCAAHERIVRVGEMVRIESPHDPARAEVAA
jgi:FlaA1/EpsC-like NDP-sugar epimerase